MTSLPMKVPNARSITSIKQLIVNPTRTFRLVINPTINSMAFHHSILTMLHTNWHLNPTNFQKGHLLKCATCTSRGHPHSNNKRNPMQLIQRIFVGKKKLQNNKIAIFQGNVFQNRHLWKSLFPASCSDHSAQYLDSASLLQCIWHLASSTTTCAEQKTKSSQAVCKADQSPST